MSSRATEVDCLKRYQEKMGSLDEILGFLLDEHLIDQENIKTIKSSSTSALLVHTYLKTLQKDSNRVLSRNGLQLLEFEWSILPVERIKITIVTDRATKEFTYNH